MNTMDIFIIAATTIDGFIGKDVQHKSTRWTSNEDFEWFQQQTKTAKICVMGRTTFETIGQLLPKRTTIVLTKNPDVLKEKFPNIVVVDLHTALLDLDSTASLDDHHLYTTSLSPEVICDLLSAKGARKLAVCGGSTVYSQFLIAGLVTRLLLTVEPVIFGTGVPLFAKEYFTNGAFDGQLLSFKLHQVHRIGPDTVVLEHHRM